MVRREPPRLFDVLPRALFDVVRRAPAGMEACISNLLGAGGHVRGRRQGHLGRARG